MDSGVNSRSTTVLYSLDDNTMNVSIFHAQYPLWEKLEVFCKCVLVGAFRGLWEGKFCYNWVVSISCECICLSVFPPVNFHPPRWWGACAQKDSVASSVGALQTYVKASRVSEGCSASPSRCPASSPVESALIILSPRENRDTSALSMVSSK